MNVKAKRFLGRWATFTSLLWLILLVGILAWWPSFYVLAPTLFPFSAYGWSGEDWTVFAHSRMGLPVDIAYSLVVGLLATSIGYHRSLVQAAGLFVIVTGASALVVHAGMHAIDFNYWYDSP